MAEDWFPWYPALFAADTLHLTAEQDGIYRRLIDWYMTNRRPLPDNDQALAAIARIGLDQWLAAAPTVRAFFQNKAGASGIKASALSHKRCDIELARQDNMARTRGIVARKGAEARWRANSGLDASSMPPAAELDAGSNADPMLPASNFMLQDRTGEEKKKRATLAKKPEAGQGKASARGTRLPPDWQPTEHNLDDGRAQGLDEATLRREADRFRDYWLGASGQNASKVDWDATWRNWIRRAKQDQPAQARARGGNVLDLPIVPRQPIDWDARLRYFARTGVYRDEWFPERPNLTPELASRFDAAEAERAASGAVSPHGAPEPGAKRETS